MAYCHRCLPIYQASTVQAEGQSTKHAAVSLAHKTTTTTNAHDRVTPWPEFNLAFVVGSQVS